MENRILYVQYTNPAGYPPLEHSSRILADRGWQVLFLGTGAHGADALEFPPHPNIEVRRWKFQQPGLWQKLHFLAFNDWVLITALRWKPNWIYASDVLACPVGFVLKKFGFRVLYHEHDSPSSDVGHRKSDVGGQDSVVGSQWSVVRGRSSAFQRFLLWTRTKLARRADLCVLPNEKRIEIFQRETGRQMQTRCVWNCLRCEDAVTPNENFGQVTLYYHGNISQELLPEELLQALVDVAGVRLLAVGYTTVGTEDYPAQFRTAAAKLGVIDRTELLTAVPRTELLSRARHCTIGWASVPMKSTNFNLRTMAGASNKAFDYLACGLPLLVSDLPDWRAMFVEPGYARACEPETPSSIVSALRWFVEHPVETHAMGERGRQRVLNEWNYETQFESVLSSLEST
jgi:glycosyltransferase involved in cell wall biosynthesis